VQDGVDETLGRQAGEGGVEGKLEQVLDPKAGQSVGAGFGVHQAEGRTLRGEELAGVGFEGDDAQRAVAAGEVDHRLVAAVDAVEVAHRDRCAAGLRVKPLVILMNLHPRPCRGRLPRQSNLRLGARTSASPFSTTVLPTEARVSRVTRRFAWSMAVTVTSARTMSPGRTGAMNLSDWPR
jgi:hypothetical protein